MSLYKHMKQLAAARDDESRPLAERVAAAEVLETTARIVHELAIAKSRELKQKVLLWHFHRLQKTSEQHNRVEVDSQK